MRSHGHSSSSCRRNLFHSLLQRRNDSVKISVRCRKTKIRTHQKQNNHDTHISTSKVRRCPAVDGSHSRVRPQDRPLCRSACWRPPQCIASDECCGADGGCAGGKNERAASDSTLSPDWISVYTKTKCKGHRVSFIVKKAEEIGEIEVLKHMLCTQDSGPRSQRSQTDGYLRRNTVNLHLLCTCHIKGIFE